MRKKIDCHTETIESVELIRTSTSWNGTSLPDYPLGKPELVAVKYIIPPGQKLGWHHHIAMNHGVLIQGELTVVGLDGQTKVFREGDVIVEMVEDIHHGEKSKMIMYMAGKIKVE